MPSDIPVEYAATLAVNPATAYRLLNDFVQLKSGTLHHRHPAITNGHELTQRVHWQVMS